MLAHGRKNLLNQIHLAGGYEVSVLPFMPRLPATCIAWQKDSTQGFQAVFNLLLLPLWLDSGAVIPIANALGWVRWLSLQSYHATR